MHFIYIFDMQTNAVHIFKALPTLSAVFNRRLLQRTYRKWWQVDCKIFDVKFRAVFIAYLLQLTDISIIDLSKVVASRFNSHNRAIVCKM